MSFSRPTTSKPASTKYATDSEPISPPEPVTIATDTSATSVDGERRAELALILANPLVHVREYPAQGRRRSPRGQAVHPRGVGDVPRDVARSILRRRRNLDGVARDLCAQLGELDERGGARRAATDVGDDAGPRAGIGELAIDEVAEVVDVEQIPNLLSGP